MGTNRTIKIVAIAVALMGVVMCAGIALTVLSIGDRDRLEPEQVWQRDAISAPSVNATDMTGDGARNVFIEDLFSIRILSASGEVLVERTYENEHTSTQGDANGDGLIDILVYYRAPEPKLELFDGFGNTLWTVNVPSAAPARALSIDFDNDGLSEFVVADDVLGLYAYDANGRFLWEYAFPAGTAGVRGLDDVRRRDGAYVALGMESGEVIVLDGNGRERWREDASGGLRRMRAFPMSGQQDNIVAIGSVWGTLSIHDGSTGETLWWHELGQAVNEIRPVEIDGDPRTTEIMAGGKDGGVWAISAAGNELWSDFLNDKVTEIISYNDPGLDGPVAVVGDDTGRVVIFSEGGEKEADFDVSGSVSRLEAAKLGDDEGFLVADSRQLTYFRTQVQTPPMVYSPILAAVAASAVIGILALLFGRLKPPPVVQVDSQLMSVEAQKARKRMLYESINDVKQMQRDGAVDANAYLARMRQLRGELAEVNQALLELGEPIRPETFSCPHCQGTLELGTDRCEYCGQVVIM